MIGLRSAQFCNKQAKNRKSERFEGIDKNCTAGYNLS